MKRVSFEMGPGDEHNRRMTVVLANMVVAIHMLAVRIAAEGPDIHSLAVVHIARVAVDQAEVVEGVCYSQCFAEAEADRMMVAVDRWVLKEDSLGIAVAQATEMVSSSTVVNMVGMLESPSWRRRSSPFLP